MTTATAHAYTAAARTAERYISRQYDTSPDWECFGARFGGAFDCDYAWCHEMSDAERDAFDGIGDFRMAVAHLIERQRPESDR